jgi:uncharacterized protein
MKLNTKRAIGLFFAVVAIFTACEEEEEKINFDRKGLLENYANNLIIPAFANLNQSMDALSSAAQQFTLAPSAEKLNTLRSNYQTAYLKYQSAGLFDFGPAMEQSFDEELNTYPTNSTIINSNISSGSYDLNAAASNPVKGFPALDYLLYGSSDSDQGTVDLFISDSNSANRKKYLTDIIADIKGTVSTVHTAWTSGNYASQFIANDGHDVGSSLGLVLNTMNEYFERDIRDAKIGIPSGIRASGTPLPNDVEALYSAKSIALANESLLAYKALFLGNGQNDEGLGFDDYLVALNAKYSNSIALSTEIVQQLDLCIQKINAIPAPLSQAVQTNSQAVTDAYNELQKLLVLLKSDSSSALGILITYEDNDGD